jgi:hypothetical protein
MLVIRQKEQAPVGRLLLIGAGIAFAYVFLSELPALRRYLKLRSM